ncbi:MAG: hypothetical protein KDE14_12800 [Rhodobacteraceae bacterium]|nr:hypothetical protein [Paracoccaceae bacterium]
MTVMRVVKIRANGAMTQRQAPDLGLSADSELSVGALGRVLAASALLALGGCSFASDSLFGDDGEPQATASVPAPVPAPAPAEEEEGGFFSNLFPSFFGSDEPPPATATPTAAVPMMSTSGSVSMPTYQGTTVVGQRVNQFRGEYQVVRNNLAVHNQQFEATRGQAISNANAYNATVGAIRARLQIGTTPGNPELLAMWQQAQAQLAASEGDLTALNQLSASVSSNAGAASYLLDSVRNAFTLSGAVDEDHRQLRMLEDDLSQTNIGIDRLLQSLNGDISRQQQFVATERSALVDLSGGINAGQFFASGAASRAMASAAAPVRSTPTTFADRRPLVVIRFDKADIAYEPALYQALSRALERRPDAVFDLVAVTPANGNSAAARRNADAVMRSMASMGLPAERVALASMNSPTASAPEVHVYVR